MNKPNRMLARCWISKQEMKQLIECLGRPLGGNISHAWKTGCPDRLR